MFKPRRRTSKLEQSSTQTPKKPQPKYDPSKKVLEYDKCSDEEVDGYGVKTCSEISKMKMP